MQETKKTRKKNVLKFCVIATTHPPQLVCDTMANKERSFHRTMELRYNAEGELLEKPEADPVDLKYMKYGVRRPWSSKYKAPQAETPIPASGLSCKTPEEIEEVCQILAIFQDFPQKMRKCRI